MLLTTPVCIILAKNVSKSSQRVTKGARPDSGKANTELSRAESNPVSVPWMNGDDADSAIRCGMKRRQAVQQHQRLVGARAADVDMLAEDGELLGQVAVELGDLVEAGLVEDALPAPLLERMRAAAAQADVEALARNRRGCRGSRCSCASTVAWSVQTPVHSSIMLSVISGVTWPGILRPSISRSRSRALGARS